MTTKEPQSATSQLSRILPYIFQYKWRVIASLVLVVIAQLMLVANPYIMKLLVDTLSLEGASASAAYVFSLVGLFFGLRFGGDLISGIQEYVFAPVTVGVKKRASADVFSHLLSLPLSFHTGQASGALARNITRGTSAMSTLSFFLTNTILPTVIELLLIVGVFLYLFPPMFTIVFLGFVVCYAAYTIIVTQRRQAVLTEMNRRDDASSQRYIDALMNYETVKYFTNEDHERSSYRSSLDSWGKKSLEASYKGANLNIGQGLILTIGLTILLAMGTQEFLSGGFTLGDFILITTYMNRVAIPLGFLGFLYRSLMESLASLDEMFRLLNVDDSVPDSADARSLSCPKGTIRFSDVHFSYDPARPILKGLDIEIPAHTSAALVGASGSGKSTVTKLLLRLYEIGQGAITLDDQDISQVTKDSLRKAIGVVAQDTILFNASIMENIQYGDTTATKEQVIEAAKLANIHERIMEFPESYETKVGERGMRLSGGEKQRIAIARMLLKNPPIFVFDEATASLDSHSERIIQDSIRSLSREKRTTLVVAHRLSTIVDFDQIIVMNQGEVVERGTHHQLLEKDGAYAALWRDQQREMPH